MALHTFTTISISCYSLHSDFERFAHATIDNGLSVMKRSYNAIYVTWFYSRLEYMCGRMRVECSVEWEWDATWRLLLVYGLLREHFICKPTYNCCFMLLAKDTEQVPGLTSDLRWNWVWRWPLDINGDVVFG